MNAAPFALDFSGFTEARSAARRGDEAALREAARQFEAVFVREMLKSANAVSFGDDGLGEHGGMVRDLRDRQMAEHLVSGRGLGLAELLARQLGGAPPVRPSSVVVPTRPAEPPVAAPEEASAAGFSHPREFVAALRPHAEQAARALGVSPRIVLAQAALETGWGRHLPRDPDGQPSHNLFGIKADGGWQGKAVRARTLEVKDGEFRPESAAFRSYNGFADSFQDYVDFLRTNPRYEHALAHGGDDARFLHALKSAGYATDPHYVDKIQQVADNPPLSELI